MKANSLMKKSIALDEIYAQIEQSNERGQFKHFIPHFIYISDDVRLQLQNDGFKAYYGEWFANDSGLVIEW